MMTKFEWWDVCRKVKPNLTWREYTRMWADFQKRKAEGRLEGQLH